MTDTAKEIRAKIFQKFNRLSFAALAREIEANTKISTTRGQVFGVVSGKLKLQHIKTQLAAILGEPEDALWPTENVKGDGSTNDA